MKKVTKIALIAVLLNGLMLSSFADRGISKKAKTKVTLNINTTKSSFSNNLSFNLKSGLKYKGSLLTGTTKTTPNTVIQGTVVTYQKGNSVYVIPYKQKIIVPEMRQGYTGVKLIIKSN
jgi:hypothetical protein